MSRRFREERMKAMAEGLEALLLFLVHDRDSVASGKIEKFCLLERFGHERRGLGAMDAVG